jgi:hypothetical protein
VIQKATAQRRKAQAKLQTTRNLLLASKLGKSE